MSNRDSSAPQAGTTEFGQEVVFGGEMGFGARAALLVVDMQLGFTDPAMPLGSPQDEEISTIQRLIQTFRSVDGPVIFMGINYQDAACSDAGHWIKKNTGVTSMVQGSRGVELDPRLGRMPGEPLLLRHYPSGFFGTDLVSQLTTRGVDTTVIVGCTTSGCVRATVVDALQYGFRPIVVSDGVADRWPEAHRQSLFDIGAKYGDVVTSEKVIQHLQSGEQAGLKGQRKEDA